MPTVEPSSMCMTCTSLLRAALTVGLSLFVLYAPRAAFASNPNFVPIQCSPGTFVNFRIGTDAPGGGSRLPFDLIRGPLCTTSSWGPCPHYPNGTVWDRKVFGNRFVSDLRYNFASFATEFQHDTLSFDHFDGTSWVNHYAQNGIIGPHTSYSNPRPVGQNFQANPDRLRFRSDASVHGPGFSISEVIASCDSTYTSGNVAGQIYRSERNSGILFGDGDVVYLRIVDSDHYGVVLWGDASNTAGADFDLYARCGALPTNTIFDQRGFRVGQQEILDLGSCNTWYLAVHSFQGAGMFNVLATPHRHNTIDVGIGIPAPAPSVPPPATIPNQYWTDVARGLFAASEGGMFVNFRNHTNPETTANVGKCGSPAVPCVAMVDSASNTGGQTRYPAPGPSAYMGMMTPVIIRIHEIGHSWLLLPDEYIRLPDMTEHIGCAGTMMSAGLLFDVFNLCTQATHRKHFGTAGPTAHPTPGWGTGSWWWSLSGNGVAPSWSMDPYDFMDFNFNNIVGSVTNVP